MSLYSLHIFESISFYTPFQSIVTLKIRSRLAALQCVTAHTATHPMLTVDYRIKDKVIEELAVDMLSLILPGVMSALQDVANCPNNPGHAVIVVSYRHSWVFGKMMPRRQKRDV